MSEYCSDGLREMHLASSPFWKRLKILSIEKAKKKLRVHFEVDQGQELSQILGRKSQNYF